MFVLEIIIIQIYRYLSSFAERKRERERESGDPPDQFENLVALHLEILDHLPSEGAQERQSFESLTKSSKTRDRILY